MHRRTVAKFCARLERMVGVAPQWTEAERAALRAHKDASRPERGAARSVRGAETTPAEGGDEDIWAGERPLVGNYGLRRTLIDLVQELGTPPHVADLISCHAPTGELMYGAKPRHGPGTRVGVYLNTTDRVLLHQAAEVVQRLRTRPYAPTRLSPMKSERKLSGGEASDFPPTQDNSEFGPHVHAPHSQAAGPPSGVAAEAGYRQAPPDTKNRRPFAVELTDIATDAELEEAAIRFANGDDAGAQAGLLSALENDGASREQAQSWALALLDLYRATGQQQPFELVSLDYARRFGRSAPIWFSMPEMLGLHHASAVERTVPSILVDEPTWCCPAHFGASEVDELRLATANVQAPWFLDWSDLADIDTGAVDPLGALFAEWCATPVELHFAGTRELEAALRALAPSGDRSVRQANWKLRLDAQRIMQSQDEFELIALDYCVTYEVSPPPWVDARCGFRREDANGSAASRGEDNAAQSREPRPSATVHMGLESLHAAVAELSGEVVGEATEVLDRLEKSRSGSMNLVVSCTNLVRVDFSAAGSILNWVANLQADGCQVQFRDVHRLVAAFFSVIGINEHARILMRSS